ncbi:MAG: DUF3179 domain-containing protein [Proteobacteria bacterium]|nr:DUF3179 domain-containing protein [Pseudomonadota bacterium]
MTWTLIAKRRNALVLLAAVGVLAAVALMSSRSNGGVEEWVGEFPKTDFSKTNIDLGEIVSGGPRRDTIPPIFEPKYIPIKDANDIGETEPVISVIINGDARAYPLRILLWHEIVNDTIGGVPVLVSYCPLCNSGVVFDRRVGGKTLVFGNTGRLRRFNMVMYDRQTESWWQQFEGDSIIGELTGQRMDLIPARLESVAKFRERAPDGLLLVPENDRARNYGLTPYERFEARTPRAVTRYGLPEGIRPMQRVVVVGEEAWTLGLLRERKRHVAGNLVFTWEPGQNSIHDKQVIAEGRDVGNVVVQRDVDGKLEDVPYDVAFAFAFRAFNPNGTIHQE